MRELDQALERLKAGGRWILLADGKAAGALAIVVENLCKQQRIADGQILVFPRELQSHPDDDEAVQAAIDLLAAAASARDIIIGCVAHSPYVEAGLSFANSQGALIVRCSAAAVSHALTGVFA